MKPFFLLLALGLILFFNSCTSSESTKETSPAGLSIDGTWQLISGTTIRGTDTTVVDYTVNQSFIKIINDNHFSFFSHDLNKGQDSTAVFTAGAGRYNLEGNNYTESLEYFSIREWEGHKFEFKVSMNADTLIQTGVEKIVELGVDQIIIEKYIKLK